MSGIIQTIKQNCRRCYSCVRDCPAKAIRIVDGQASVVTERCVACGNCTVVCSQNAKAYVSGLDEVVRLTSAGGKVAALLAPSFPADPFGGDPAKLVGALRAAGFTHVVEVAYGADLVSCAYRTHLAEHTQGIRIATCCPAVVEYVRKYCPDLVDHLIPLVSPMVATAQAVRARYGQDVACVFIGPCVAKKLEACDRQILPVVNEVLTFQELHSLLFQRNVKIADATPSDFDPPRAGLGRVFPLVGGLLKTAGLERNLFNPDIVVLSGPHETIDVLQTLKPDDPHPLLIEAMMCRGCYSGPGLGGEDKRLVRKRRVAEYVHDLRAPSPGSKAHESDDVLEQEAARLPLGRTFARDDQRLKEPTEADLRVILARTNKFTREDELNCGACGYPTCRAKAVAVHRGLAEEAMCLPFMIEQAERVCHELKVPANELKEIHRHLINTEKLASMGQMAAGVAHELNNPLGTILLYTNLLERKLKERDDLRHDLKLLCDEAQRCKKIIGMLLDFARQNRVRLETTRLAALLHRAVDESRFAAEVAGTGIEIVASAPEELAADVDTDQIGQVLVNLIKNGIEAMEGKSGTIDLVASEAADPTRVRITVSDQGRGIPPEARDRVFQPFFTTKSIGKGTGLGLPIAYGIVKMHRGAIWFESEVGRGTRFIIEIPKSQAIGRSIINEPKS